MWVPDAGLSPLANKPILGVLDWSTKVKTQCDHSSTEISRIVRKTRTENNNIKQITNIQINSINSTKQINLGVGWTGTTFTISENVSTIIVDVSDISNLRNVRCFEM
jgi:hypothetical protein